MEAASRHGLHRTSKTLQMDYVGLKKRLMASHQKITSAVPAFVELLAPAGSSAAAAAEYVVQFESAEGRVRVATKGAPLDWASQLRALAKRGMIQLTPQMRILGRRRSGGRTQGHRFAGPTMPGSFPRIRSPAACSCSQPQRHNAQHPGLRWPGILACEEASLESTLPVVAGRNGGGHAAGASGSVAAGGRQPRRERRPGLEESCMPAFKNRPLVFWCTSDAHRCPARSSPKLRAYT